MLEEVLNKTSDIIELRRKQLALDIINEAWKWAKNEITLDNALKAAEQELKNAGL